MRIPLLILLTLIGTVGCSSTPGPGESGGPDNVSGLYTGHFHVDGQPFAGTLQLRTSRERSVRGAFRVSVPVEIEGKVQGEIVRDLLSMEITYADERGCRSRIEGLLRITDDGGTLSGPVTVHDCGTETAGRMTFTRAERRPGSRGASVRLAAGHARPHQ